MTPKVVEDSRYMKDPNEVEEIELDKEQVKKDLKKVENKLKMEKIDKKLEKEIQYNINYTSQRKPVPTKELPFTKVKNKNKVVFNQEWDENNRKIV